MTGLAQSRFDRLLIRAVNWIGDAIMTTPAIEAVRANLPQAEITLLANPAVAQLLQHFPALDRIITFDRAGIHRGVTGRLRLARELRRERFDAAVILPNSFDSALVPWLAGIPRRLGKSSDGRGLLLTDRPAGYREEAGRHEVESYLELLRSLGFAVPAETAGPRLVTTPAEQEAAAALLSRAGIQPGGFLLGVNPGAAFGSAKRWYPERFAAAARTLAGAWRARIVIFGGPDETAIAGEIERCLAGDCLNLAGRTNLRQLMALIRRCDFFITNDSGPMHIAAAFGVPLVAVFGPTDHTGTSPYGAPARIVRKETDCAPCKLRECPTDHRCMTAIAAEDVVQAALQLVPPRNGQAPEPTGQA